MSNSVLRALARGRVAVLAVAAITAAACGSSSSTNVTGPTTASRCAVSLTATPASQGASGGTGQIGVSTNRECDWSARAEVDWIQLATTRGQGDGTLGYTVTANAQPALRRGGVVINDQRVEIEQAAANCQFSLGSGSGDIGGGGGALDVTVQATGACAWTASSGDPWITVASGGSGTGNGTVRLSVAANGSAEARTGTATIAGQTYTVRQAGAGGATPAPGCTFTLDPVALSLTAAASVETVRVTASQATCTWTAQPSVPWITVQSGSGRGNGTISLQVAENTTNAARVGAVTVGGTAIAISQAAPGAPRTPAANCAFTVAPTSDTVPAGGRTGQITVTATEPSCAWAAASPVDWITLASPSGTGSGPLGFTVAANPQQQERSATLTVAGLSVGITQAAAPPAEPDCTYAVSASSFDVGSGAGTRSLSLDTNRNNCAWSASSPVSWITLDKTSGQGDAQFTLTIAENTAEQSRSAVVTIAGRQVTVTQAAAPPPSCTFSVSPTSQTAPASGATRTSSIVASRGNCDWTASSPVNWITVNPGSGRGNADVRLTIAENTGQQDRSATVTIAGQPVTVTQAGASAPCTFAVSPGSLNLPAGGGAQPVGVDASANSCTWSTSGAPPWISLAPSNGTGDAQVTVTAQPNTGQQSRTATLTIAGQQVNVSQAAAPAPCTFTVSPGSLNLPAAGGAQPVTVTASAGTCAWSSRAARRAGSRWRRRAAPVTRR